MRILVFTEGTALMHLGGKNLSREERVHQSNLAGIQREEIYLKLGSKTAYKPAPGSVHDYSSYIPVGNVVHKLIKWKEQNASIYYLSSRRTEDELKEIKNVLNKFSFPDPDNLLYREEGENYKDVVKRFIPDVLIEDDCESIGGEVEMTYPHIRADLKAKIKSVVVKEFGGIDHLPDDVNEI